MGIFMIWYSLSYSCYSKNATEFLTGYHVPRVKWIRRPKCTRDFIMTTFTKEQYQSSKCAVLIQSEKCALNYKASVADTKSSVAARRKAGGSENRCEDFLSSWCQDASEEGADKSWTITKLLKELRLIF